MGNPKAKSPDENYHKQKHRASSALNTIILEKKSHFSKVVEQKEKTFLHDMLYTLTCFLVISYKLNQIQINCR